jgi:hypothetical protein
MSEVKVNKISPRTNCGTVQLGDSGDTITIPAGATIVNNGTQTGFGRTGTVDWDTTAKTASFTAVSGNGYFVNTTSGAITVTLPASPSAGDIVAFNDYARTFATNNLTVARNGSNIQGTAADGTIATNGQSTMFVYVDGTQGWVPTEDQTTGNYGAAFITATGGTVTTCGNFKIHTFTGPGTFTVCSVGNPSGSDSVDYLVVAGGGSGASSPNANIGGGGGAGGYRESSGAASGCYTTSPLGACVSALPVTAQGYPITVGGGGAAIPTGTSQGNDGSNSVFSTITSTGGGGASGPACAGGCGGRPGGSGGGSSGGGPVPAGGKVGGTGNTPPVSPPQGNDGGNAGFATPDQVSAGGGGATAAGDDANHPSNITGNGGAGATTSISGSPTAYAGGGGGAAGSTASQGTGGTGGGGPGGYPYPGAGTAGTTNTGGGGGGGGAAASGAGGSGIVIIRYKYQ